MQVKKEEVALAIRHAAIDEFLSYGYDKSSLRRIVKNAGTTLGNLYNYYPSKELLFESIVNEPYTMLTKFATGHNTLEGNDDLWLIRDVNIWRNELRKLIHSFLPLITKPFIILMTGSQGSSYENAKSLFVQVLSEHFIEHIDEFNPQYQCPEMAPVFAKQLIDGIIDIVTLYEDESIQEKLIIEQILFFALGTMALIAPDLLQ